MARPPINKHTRRNLFLVAFFLLLIVGLLGVTAFFNRAVQLSLPEEHDSIVQGRLALENGYLRFAKALETLKELPKPAVNSNPPVENASPPNIMGAVLRIENTLPDNAPEWKSYLESSRPVQEMVRESLNAPCWYFPTGNTLFFEMEDEKGNSPIAAISLFRLYGAKFLYYSGIEQNMSEAGAALEDAWRLSVTMASAGRITSTLRFRPEFDDYGIQPDAWFAMERFPQWVAYLAYAHRDNDDFLKALASLIQPYIANTAFRKAALRSYCIELDDTLIKPILKSEIRFHDRVRIMMVSKNLRQEAAFIHDHRDDVEKQILGSPEELRQWLEKDDRYIPDRRRGPMEIKGPPLFQLIRRAAEIEANWAAASLAIALERYRLAKGALPESLDVLAPEYQEKPSLCPLNNKPFHYIRTPDTTAFQLKSSEEGISWRNTWQFDYATATGMANNDPKEKVISTESIKLDF